MIKLPINETCKNCGHYVYFLGYDINGKEIWVHSPDLCLWCKKCECKNQEPKSAGGVQSLTGSPAVGNKGGEK